MVYVENEKKMRIITCIKYVPTRDGLNTELVAGNRNLIGGEINPSDMFAIEENIRIKERYGAEAVGLCMGVPSAADALSQSIAMGLDNVILMSDYRFAGSDTYATSYILSRGIKYIGAYDLVICGRQSTDGDTGQTAQELAAHLDVPCIINVASLVLIEKGLADCKILTERGYLEVRLQLPAVISVLKGINVPRLPSVAGILKAQSADIKIVSAEDIDIEIGKCGLCGSPTKVKSIHRHSAERRKGIDITGGYISVVEDAIKKVWKSEQTDLHIGQHRLVGGNVKVMGLGKREEVWILCEISGGEISITSKQLLSKAFEIITRSQRLCAVILGLACANFQESLRNYGVERIYSIEEKITASIFDESMPNTLCAACRKYKPSIVLFGGTVWGKWIAPLVAAKLGTGLTADCLDLRIGEDTGNLYQIRPAYGGDVVAEIVCPERRPQMATVRTNVFRDLPRRGDSELMPETINMGRLVCRESRITVTGMQCVDSGDAFAKNLENADIVLCGGRGIGGKKGFEELFGLARRMGGSVGATRYAVDAGWIDYSFQIGQTGVAVRPKVYINFGVSGAIEHIMGMRGAGCVISINHDLNAPIFMYSDYKIVDNCNTVLNKLMQYFVKQERRTGV